MKVIGENEQLKKGTTVAAIGMFDGVHLGHVTLIGEVKRQAAAHGLHTAVITFRQHPQLVLHHGSDLKMIMTVEDKITSIAKQNVDYTVLLDFTRELSLNNSMQFIKMLRDNYGVAVLVVGYNHHFGHDTSETFTQYVAHGRELGVEIVKAPEYLGEYAPVSSSIIRRLIVAGKVDDAMRCMGKPFTLHGKVIHGFHNGRNMGFPTANVGDIDPSIILPHHGAYAVMVETGGHWLQGMANIGNRPTLNNGTQVSIEVNIFDFNEDIYGKDITLEFIKFLRLEFKLGSVEELKAQLVLDRQKSIKILSEYNKSQYKPL